MRRKEIIELYNVLSPCKLTGMDSKGKMAVIRDLRQLRPVAEAHDKELEELASKLKPDGFDDRLERAKEHNNSVNSGKGPTLAPEEVMEISKAIEAYDKEMREAVAALMEEETEITLEKPDTASLEKLMDANDIEAGKLEVLYKWLSQGGR